VKDILSTILIYKAIQMRQNMIIISLLIVAFLAIIFFVVVIPNSGAKGIVISFSAMVGAAVMFLINYNFELKSHFLKDTICTEVTINHQKPEISQHFYPIDSNPRIHIDITASEEITRKQPDLFIKKPQKLMHDFLWYSFFGFLLSKENDWKSTQKTYKSSYRKSFRTNPDQKGNDTCFSIEDIQNLLKENKNYFSDVGYYGLVQQILFFPPSTNLSFHNNKLEIMNNFIIIQVKLDDSQSVSFMNPNSKLAHADTLANGKPKYETRFVNFDYNIEFRGSRAGSTKMVEYKKWTERIIESCREWFELPIKSKPEPPVFETKDIQF